MYCKYCEGSNLRQSRYYNIENVRERFNPTYSHAQIFGPTQPVSSKVRCTPTYHSQAFRVDGYGHNCKGKCSKKQEVVKQNVNICGGAKLTNKSGDFPNMRGKSCYNSRVKWYDQQKNEKFNHIQNTYDYSRQRKYADLASSSVFDGYVYQIPYTQKELCKCVNCQCVDCQCGKTKNADYSCCKVPTQKRSAGCQCQVCTCVNCQCGVAKQVSCECADSPQRKQVQQVQNQGCSCIDCKCVNCQCGTQAVVNSCKCVNCQCVDCQCGKKVEVKNCQCVNCQCINCNCGSGQKVTQPKNIQVAEEEKPSRPIAKIGNQQVTFGKKRANKIQKGLSQPRKVVKEKPTYTVIRQKK